MLYFPWLWSFTSLGYDALLPLFYSDINECEEQTNSCEQKCVNKVGGYTCECLDGYSMQNGSCKIGNFHFLPVLHKGIT